MISIAPSFLRKTGASKEVLQAQQVSADPMVYQQFPTFFILNDTVQSSRCRVEFKVAAKASDFIRRRKKTQKERKKSTASTSGGMALVTTTGTAATLKTPLTQFYVVIDVFHSRFTLLSLERKVIASFEFQQLSAADFITDDLSLRVVFKNRNGCCSFTYKDPVWSITLHTMSDAQLKYVGALVQGFVGLHKSLNRQNNILCSPEFVPVGRETFKLWIGTWNMGGVALPKVTPSKFGLSPSLKTWLKLDEVENDMYVIGTQEMHEGLIENATDLLGNGYLLISSKIMGQIGIAVFMKRRMLSFVTNIETMFEATGFGGIGTNKGFVATSLMLLGSFSFC
jgi:hypothetical protein